LEQSGFIGQLLQRYGLEGTLLLAVLAVGIFLTSLVAAIIFNKLIFPLILRFTDWIPTDLDSRLIRGIRFPLTLAIVLLGLYLSVTLPFDLSVGQQDIVNKAAGLMAIVLGIVAVASAVSGGFGWYIDHMALRTVSTLDERLLPLFRRIIVALIYGLGALLILDQLGLNISPLIAGLGLGGLAVALALQPTLSNLFAGTYVMTEGVVNPGDYVELENGLAGYVLDVSWRSTRIRTFYNNLVIVPNSRFAETIITNYQEPSPPMNIIVSCGVSYDSDLYHVEQVCREVMDEVLESSAYGVKEYGSWFGFENFGESNVDFWLFIQAKDRISSFFLRTELIELLRERFRQEGIVINYPVRTLQFSSEIGPEAVASIRQSASAARPGPNGRQQNRHRRRSPRRTPRPGVHLPPDMGQGPEGSPGGPDGPGGG
jgi:small-conductance mechanosensitive channel